MSDVLYVATVGCTSRARTYTQCISFVGGGRGYSESRAVRRSKMVKSDSIK